MNTAILGLGIIGEAWAQNFRADGVSLRVWNRTPKPFPGFQESVQEAIRGAEVVFLVVADSAAVHGVVDTILPVLQPSQIILQCSTITPASVQLAAEKVKARGANLLDTPFTGSKPAAEKRQTVFFAGGDPALLDRVKPVMDRLSRAILRVGGIGAGSAIKLAMNLNIAEVAQALSESLQVARASGISDDLYFQALQLNVSKSGLADLKEPKLRASDFSPQFSLKHMYKDLRQAREMAGSHPLPQLDRTIEIYEQGMRQGWADDDFIGLIRLLNVA
jgi:3-hydroxyisobutyrate dehydrogenase-like beta-hydroxyacid dehydrogenase